MIDLHCHILPGLDDGSKSLDESLAMARMAVADGTTVIACTPHIFPSVFENTGPQILRAVEELRAELAAAEIPLHLVSGGDVHIAPGLAGKLRSGEALSLNGSRYVLIEPPHHVMPPRLPDLFYDLQAAGYVPILTHPERLSWIDRNYGMVQQMGNNGVWMQITAGSLTGQFGPKAKEWSERMLRDGLVQILASDGHGQDRRQPMMGSAFRRLCSLVGPEEASNLVQIRPDAILHDLPVDAAPPPPRSATAPQSSMGAQLFQRVSNWLRGA